MHPEISIEVRAARPEDADAIRNLVRAAYARWIPFIGREPRPMNADYDLAVREHAIDLLCIGPAMVGLIETMIREDHLWIENVAVRPDCQGKGLGRTLLAHAEQKALAAGRVEIRLLTNAAFETNVALYEKVGYVIVDTEPFMGGATVHMSKRLDR